FAETADFERPQQNAHDGESEKQRDEPGWNVAVMRALQGKRERGIEPDDREDQRAECAEHLRSQALQCRRHDQEKRAADAEGLAIQAAFETGVNITPVHASLVRNRQSRSNSLMLVLARVRSSTRFTITAQ